MHEATPGGAASSQGLRVVTWNVGEVYWPWHGNQLQDGDVDSVIAGLDALDADVVLLQELGHEGQLRRLERDGHGRPRYLGAVPAGCGYDRQVAVLVRPALAPTFCEHRLAPTSRGIVEARFRVGGRAVRALCLHFDVFRPARRLAQARAVLALLRAGSATLTVAGGDLNYDPEAARRLGSRDDEAVEAALAGVLRDVAVHSGPTLMGLLRVDRLFAGGAALGEVRVRVSSERTPIGDHAPLVCDFMLAPTIDGLCEGP